MHAYLIVCMHKLHVRNVGLIQKICKPILTLTTGKIKSKLTCCKSPLLPFPWSACSPCDLFCRLWISANSIVFSRLLESGPDSFAAELPAPFLLSLAAGAAPRCPVTLGATSFRLGRRAVAFFLACGAMQIICHFTAILKMKAGQKNPGLLPWNKQSVRSIKMHPANLRCMRLSVAFRTTYNMP